MPAGMGVCLSRLCALCASRLPVHAVCILLVRCRPVICSENILQTPENVRAYIAEGLECTHLEVDGDGRHFDAIIVSDAFEGKRPVQRHQLVYGVLGDRMKEEIHALSIKALTPSEWHALNEL